MINPNNPNAATIRPPVSDGQTVARPGDQQQQGPQIQNGAVVEGLVTAKEGDAYLVRIGNQMLNARSTIPLFIGQRFRAVWDSSTAPPMLRLQQSDMAVLARFTGKDQQIATALLSRGLSVKDDVIWGLRQQWMHNGGDPSKLGVMVELWARGAAMTENNIALLSWYMELLPGNAFEIWKKIRDRLHERKYNSPKELLSAIKGDDDADVRKFLQAHALAGKPARRGLDPAMLMAPAWWPVGDEESGRSMMARVSISTEELEDRRAWWLAFEMEGDSLGPVFGAVMTNGRAMSISLRLRDESKLDFVQDNLPELRDDLSEVPLVLQYLGIGTFRQDEMNAAARQGLDLEA
jgi:hypothetical protein